MILFEYLELIESIHNYFKNSNIKNMKLVEFLELIRTMRAKQREYFQSRSPRVLKECIKLERQVDNLLDPTIKQLKEYSIKSDE